LAGTENLWCLHYPIDQLHHKGIVGDVGTGTIIVIRSADDDFVISQGLLYARRGPADADVLGRKARRSIKDRIVGGLKDTATTAESQDVRIYADAIDIFDSKGETIFLPFHEDQRIADSLLHDRPNDIGRKIDGTVDDIDLNVSLYLAEEYAISVLKHRNRKYILPDLSGSNGQQTSPGIDGKGRIAIHDVVVAIARPPGNRLVRGRGGRGEWVTLGASRKRQGQLIYERVAIYVLSSVIERKIIIGADERRRTIQEGRRIVAEVGGRNVGGQDHPLIPWITKVDDGLIATASPPG
jgi:hypothetical protein